MDIKELKCAKIVADIKEIDDTLNAIYFDRQKAENMIRKHSTTDETVAAINSPLSPSYTTFERATDDMVKNNLLIIREVLLGNLAKEQFNG
ncbi:MAG: hypothetical protein K2K24_02220 [Clostridia bacterium]|nr:hypothetical protein [Clostridia bacterium]